MATKNKTNNESANVQNNAQVDNPMMKQFRDLKAKHPDAILLFRCGDFYEAYEDDAKAVAEVCGITLTKRADGTAMAGFPHHAIDTYLPKLIRAGKRTAICDQLEKPKPTAKREEEPKAETKTEEPKAEKPKTSKPKTSKPKSGKPKAKAEEEKPKLTYETYTSKKGKACARIKGFSEDDAIYQNADAVHASKTWERDKKGNKTYMLVFGPVYAEAAKQLCEAINSGSKEAITAAQEAVGGALDAHRKEREEKRAEYKARKSAPKPKTYTEQEVLELMRRVAAGDKEAMELVNTMAA